MIEALIYNAFPSGLPYNSAAQLCLRLYCTLDLVPKEYHSDCTKEGLSQAFAELARQGFIIEAECCAETYGAEQYELTDENHWFELISSILKRGDVVDTDLGTKLVLCLFQ